MEVDAAGVDRGLEGGRKGKSCQREREGKTRNVGEKELIPDTGGVLLSRDGMEKGVIGDRQARRSKFFPMSAEGRSEGGAQPREKIQKTSLRLVLRGKTGVWWVTGKWGA